MTEGMLSNVANPLNGLPNRDLLRIDEVARYFDVSERTVRLWIDHSLLIVERRGRLVWITRESISVFRLRNRTEPVM